MLTVYFKRLSVAKDVVPNCRMISV